MASGGSIGRYRLDELVGRGGMGEVWRACDETLDRVVAVKLYADFCEPGEHAVRDRFLTEARAVARLDHPNVVAVYDIGESDGRPYLVMELLEGRTVADVHAECGPLPVSEMRDIGAQVAAGLGYAHTAGVIHRDVKPENLMWAGDGTVKLVDFGLARLIENSTPRLTPAGKAMGTIAYTSPETAMGAAGDGRSDLYSLGCVLYELLCGRPPFVGELPVVAHAHVYSEPDPPSTYRPDVPADLEALVMALLAKEPESRPASGDVVRDCLLERNPLPPLPYQYRAASGSVSGHSDSSALHQPSGRRRRTGLAAIGTLAAAGILVGTTWWAVDQTTDDGAFTTEQPPSGPSQSRLGSPQDQRGSEHRSQDPAAADEAVARPREADKPEAGQAASKNTPNPTETKSDEPRPDEPTKSDKPGKADKRDRAGTARPNDKAEGAEDKAGRAQDKAGNAGSRQAR